MASLGREDPHRVASESTVLGLKETPRHISYYDGDLCGPITRRMDSMLQ